MSQTPKQTDEGGEVVYRRLNVPESESQGQGAGGGASAEVTLAPTLKPFLVVFVLLLVLVFLLGLFSVRELADVETGTSILQIQQTNRVRQLLNLTAATNRLDYEARIRAAAQARGELMPPLELRLSNARNDVSKQLMELDSLPYAQQENWRILREQLARFVETTRDLEAYSLDGFVQFRDIQSQFGKLEEDLKREQQEVDRQSKELSSRSSNRVRLWWLSALVIGFLVTAATVFEVQRRFRQEQQSLEEARRERQFSTQMLEGMVSAVAAIDARARLRSANTAFFQVFPEASIGISVYDKFAPPEATKLLEAAVSHQVEKATYRGRWTLGAGDGAGAAVRTFDVYSSPLEIDGETGQVVTLVDVSEAVEAEAVLRRTEALAAVGQASAQVAHEIRNPLGSIRLGVSILRDMTSDQESLRTIDLVERGINHLNKLVVDVTQFSRAKALTPTELELHQLLDSSLELVADRIKEHDTVIEKHFNSEPLRGHWDEGQLRQVFVNLIANAIDASPSKATVTITTERTKRELRHPAATDGNGQPQPRPAAPGIQHLARITITDRGHGIDEASRARIFEPFFTTKKRGTGLGLAIVKQIVEQHGGVIALESTPGKETRFIIDLPLDLVE